MPSKTRDAIQKNLVAAMKAKEDLKLQTLRMLKAALINKDIEKKSEIFEEEEFKVIQTLIKQRRDAAEQFKKGGRKELMEKEEAEIKILEAYLPEMISEEEIQKIVQSVIQDLGAQGPQAMGQVMKETMSRLKGQMVEGKAVKDLVQKALS